VTELAQLTRRLVAGTAHWSPAAWAARITPVAAAASGPGAASTEPGTSAVPRPADRPSRADVLHGLVQQLADLGAEVESRPSQPVPRLANDLALPDPLRVMATDLIAAPAPVLARAEAALHATHRALFPPR
jgi:hypothetical protein